MYKLTGSAIVRNDEDHRNNLAYNLAKANFKDIQYFYDEKCIKQNKSHLFFEKELDRTNDKHPCHKTPIPYCKFSIGGQYEEGATRFVEGEKVPFQTSDLRELVRDMPYEINVISVPKQLKVRNPPLIIDDQTSKFIIPLSNFRAFIGFKDISEINKILEDDAFKNLLATEICQLENGKINNNQELVKAFKNLINFEFDKQDAINATDRDADYDPSGQAYEFSTNIKNYEDNLGGHNFDNLKKIFKDESLITNVSKKVLYKYFLKDESYNRGDSLFIPKGTPHMFLQGDFLECGLNGNFTKLPSERVEDYFSEENLANQRINTDQDMDYEIYPSVTEDPSSSYIFHTYQNHEVNRNQLNGTFKLEKITKSNSAHTYIIENDKESDHLYFCIEGKVSLARASKINNKPTNQILFSKYETFGDLCTKKELLTPGGICIRPRGFGPSEMKAGSKDLFMFRASFVSN